LQALSILDKKEASYVISDKCGKGLGILTQPLPTILVFIILLILVIIIFKRKYKAVFSSNEGESEE